MPVRVVLNLKGFDELRKSPSVMAELERRGRAIAARAGEGFESESAYEGRHRGRVQVYTATPEAMVAEATEHRLLRALDAGRD